MELYAEGTLPKALIAALLREGSPGLKAAFDNGFNPDLLRGDSKAAIEFIVTYASDYGSMPPADVVASKFALTDLTFHDLGPATPVSFLVSEIKEQRVAQMLNDGFAPIGAALAERKPIKALETIEELAYTIRKQSILVQSQVRSLFSLAPQVIEFYKRLEAGERGVLTPWPSINEATLGFWPEDLVLFVARSGVGKTWASVLIMHYAWKKQGKKVLYVTTEMSQLRIAMRFYAVEFALPYHDFSHATLPTALRDKFFEKAKELENDPLIKVMGGDFDFRVESVSAAIDEVQPDIVVIDGIYLLKTSGDSRTEQAANIFNEVKRLNKRKKVPIVVTSQMNRQSKVGNESTMRAEHIALTDVAVWNADLIFGMVQDDGMKAGNRMKMVQMKMREGRAPDFELNWNFSNMDFTELPSGPPGMSISDAADTDPYTGGATGNHLHVVPPPDDPEVPF